MLTVECIPGSLVTLGKVGDNLTTRVHFDVSEWLSENPNATLTLIHKRPLDTAATPVSRLVWDAHDAYWEVTSGDVAQAGHGIAELILTDDDKIYHSKTISTKVLPSIAASEDKPPGPHLGWVEEVIQSTIIVRDAAEKFTAISDNISIIDESVRAIAEITASTLTNEEIEQLLA